MTVIHDDMTMPPPSNKAFIFNCEHEFIEGPFGLEKITLELGETEKCALKISALEPNIPVNVATNLRNGIRSTINVDPVNGATDNNGELEFTIKAIKKGVDWIAWGVPNKKGNIEFNRKTFDAGLAWGMFVEVR